MLYVCHGHCSGPECEFTQSIRHWQSMVMLQSGQVPPCGEAANMANSTTRLDIDRVELSQMREVLAGKLERKRLRKGGGSSRASGRVKSATLDRHHDGGQRRPHSSMSGRVARLSDHVMDYFPTCGHRLHLCFVFH